MGETYYELLGVPEDATKEEIERAYRQKLKETHPDVSDRADASERTKRLIEARETLTDETERRRYDRQGHETYLDRDISDRDTAATEATGTDSGQQTDASTGGQTWRNKRKRKRQRRKKTSSDASSTDRQRTTHTQNVGSGAEWANHSRGDERESENDVGPYESNRRYAVSRGKDVFRLANIFERQQSMILLGMTFLVYPVLLFGALSTTFPLPLNLFVAACVIFVIAFLQSVPEVGIVVFAAWTVLLPPILFLGLGFSPVSLQSILAVTAVVFPLGLSALTRLAIRPVTAT